jgi:hypothetical protein
MNAQFFSGDKKYKVLFYVLLGLIAGVAFFILFGFFVKLLWNVTVTAVFDVSPITFWQAVGLFVLAKLLFGFGLSGGGTPAHRRKKGRRHADGKHDEAGVGDEAFRQFWQEEGKAAYEAYRDQRRDGEAGDTS